jgi:hypothetical protein
MATNLAQNEFPHLSEKRIHLSSTVTTITGEHSLESLHDEMCQRANLTSFFFNMYLKLELTTQFSALTDH